MLSSDDIEKRMEELGFELVALKNNRLFYKHKEHGQLVRRKNAKHYLKHIDG